MKTSGLRPDPEVGKGEVSGEDVDDRRLDVDPDVLKRSARGAREDLPRNARRGRESRAWKTSTVRTLSRPRPPSRYFRAFPSQESSSRRRRIALTVPPR
jgi:hypothetical protein